LVHQTAPSVLQAALLTVIPDSPAVPLPAVLPWEVPTAAAATPVAEDLEVEDNYKR